MILYMNSDNESIVPCHQVKDHVSNPMSITYVWGGSRISKGGGIVSAVGTSFFGSLGACSPRTF